MRKIVVILLICFVSKVWGNKISDAYEALSIYDYFKAKQLFYKSLKKYPAESSFGLATIYFRTDNPFSNIDSSAKYISICKTQFKDTVTYSQYHLNTQSIDALSEQIGNKGFNTYCQSQSVINLNHFLSHFYFANDSLLFKSFYTRDELKLQSAISSQSSDSINQFLLSYPQSSLYNKAQKTFYNFQYAEKTPQKNKSQLQLFIKKFPNNHNVSDAEITLFQIIQQFHSGDSIYYFIKNYSTALTNETAWKLLYSLSVKNYNKEELTGFLNKYPDYPYNETIIKEISLSQNILIPLKNMDDKYGYVDTLGHWIITPQFDDANSFYEGFAAVCKNDSCFYINKEGYKTSNYYFEETENYKDGIAIVKKDNNYFLINRSGQIISKGYQDINEVSDKLYVCKANNIYGAINSKGEIIIPFSYTQLGNFKNKFAYYTSTQYGLVDINNKALLAQWDWISDVDTNSVAIVKKKNQFGLIAVNETLILPTEYDYITHCVNEIYLTVKNNLYGFYNVKEKCFVTSIDYDYNPSFEPSYYTNGKNFKLIRDNEVALVDANGRYSINFGTYSNLFFAKCDIIRIQKNNKYGFVDRKLKPVSNVEFELAQDFKNDVAIVSKKGIYQLINTQGKSIFAIKDGRITDDLTGLFYRTSIADLTGLINYKGELLLNAEYTSIEQIMPCLFYCKKADGIYLYNSNSKTLKKL